VGGVEDNTAGSAVREEGRVSEDGQVAGTIHQFQEDRQETGDWERFLRYLCIYLISRIPLMASGQEGFLSVHLINFEDFVDVIIDGHDLEILQFVSETWVR
jgi:hypothetical protein